MKEKIQANPPFVFPPERTTNFVIPTLSCQANGEAKCDGAHPHICEFACECGVIGSSFAAFSAVFQHRGANSELGNMFH